MRLRASWILAAGLATVLVYGQREGWQTRLNGLFDSLREGPFRNQTVTNQTYLVPEDGWLDFQLPPQGQVLRVMTTANLPARSQEAQFGQDEAPAAYAITFQMLDDQRRVVEQNDYHFRSRLVRYQIGSEGTASLPAFYTDGALLPAATRAMLYPLQQRQPRPCRLRLRLSSRDPGIADVAVRVYCRVEDHRSRDPNAWQRVSVPRRENLCRGSAYPPELLSAEERRNLLRNRWTPLAPVGLAGTDYARRTMYLHEELEDRVLEQAIPPAGLPLRPGIRCVVPLPEPPGRVRLVCTPAGEMATALATGPLSVRWYGKGLQNRRAEHFPSIETATPYELPVHGGLLELDSPCELIVNASWQETGGNEPGPLLDITPPREYLMVFRTDQAEGVEYAVAPDPHGAATPFRLWLYGLLGPAETAKASRIVPSPPAQCRWQFLDEGGNVIQEGILTAPSAISRYDYVADACSGLQITDPSTFYFEVPRRARRLRFESLGGPALVCGFTRPPDLPKEVRVPEDYYAYHREHGLRRSWFNALPLAGESEAREQTLRIVIQPRPPQDDPWLSAGEFQWQDYHPEGLWKARYLLISRDPSAATSAELPRTLFTELAANREHQVDFVLEPGRRQLHPKLVYRTEAALPQTLAVYLEGRLHDQIRICASSGEVPLPPIPADRPRLTCRLMIAAPEGTRVFLSSIDPAGRPTRWKRLANRLENGRLSFAYVKEEVGQEMLNLRFYPATPQPDRLRLRVTISGSRVSAGGALASWTILQRRYELRPAGDLGVLVLEASDTLTDGGQTCFLPLGSDLPPATYLIEVHSEDAADGYVLLSRTIPGQPETRTVHLEPR